MNQNETKNLTHKLVGKSRMTIQKNVTDLWCFLLRQMVVEH